MLKRLFSKVFQTSPELGEKKQSYENSRETDNQTHLDISEEPQLHKTLSNQRELKSLGKKSALLNPEKGPLNSQSIAGALFEMQNCQLLAEPGHDQAIDSETALTKEFAAMEGMQCAICLDFIISCRTAVCGHSFCAECIQESMIRKRECPHCRKDIRAWCLTKSELIDRAVELMVRSKTTTTGDASQETRWSERLENNRRWVAKHEISSTTLKAGSKLDVLDTEHIWCPALVELKITCSNGSPLILVHYEGWSRKYDEFLSLMSHRVAPIGTYTNRNDIPRYRMCLRPGSAVTYAHVLENGRADQIDQADAPVAAASSESADDPMPALEQNVQQLSLEEPVVPLQLEHDQDSSDEEPADAHPLQANAEPIPQASSSSNELPAVGSQDYQEPLYEHQQQSQTINADFCSPVEGSSFEEGQSSAEQLHHQVAPVGPAQSDQQEEIITSSTRNNQTIQFHLLDHHNNGSLVLNATLANQTSQEQGQHERRQPGSN